jgi:ubiquitin-protein ligase
MASQVYRRLLSRLDNDLAELRNTPYPGVAVFTDDADLRKLCLVLSPPSGPWKDLALHFDVILPEEWVNFVLLHHVACT